MFQLAMEEEAMWWWGLRCSCLCARFALQTFWW